MSPIMSRWMAHVFGLATWPGLWATRLWTGWGLGVERTGDNPQSPVGQITGVTHCVECKQRNPASGIKRLPARRSDYRLEDVAALEEITLLPSIDEIVLCLEPAQELSFLNFADWVMTDRSKEDLGDDEERWVQFRLKLRRLVIVLMEKSFRLPDALFLNNDAFSLDKSPDGQVIRQGFGVYADVYSGELNSARVGIKAFRPFEDTEPQSPQNSNPKVVWTLQREIVLHRWFRHPHIFAPIGIIKNPFPGSSICVVSPWAAQGHVLAFLHTCSPGPEVLIRILMQVADALAYLHHQGVAHGDLHPRNILIDQKGEARLVDIGVTRFIESLPASISLTRMGGLRWTAPEILEADQEGLPISHTTRSDVFSFAMCAFHIWSGKPPFADVRPGRAKQKVISGDLPPRPHGIPENLWKLINSCWERNPANRPSADILLTCLRGML